MLWLVIIIIIIIIWPLLYCQLTGSLSDRAKICYYMDTNSDYQYHYPIVSWYVIVSNHDTTLYHIGTTLSSSITLVPIYWFWLSYVVKGNVLFYATLRSAWVIRLPLRKLDRSDTEQCSSCNLYIWHNFWLPISLSDSVMIQFLVITRCQWQRLIVDSVNSWFGQLF